MGRLDRVYWIGGGSGAGKSTVADHVARRYGLTVYSTDRAMSDHASRCTTAQCSQLAAFMAMDMDERWLNRSPDVMLDTFHWFRGEGFHCIVDDLLDLTEDVGVVAEGFRLLPHLVGPLLTDQRHAVWLLPSRDFRRRAFESRGTLWNIPNTTSDPSRALRNLLERDSLFTDRLRADAARLHLETFELDDCTPEDDVTSTVAQLFGLHP